MCAGTVVRGERVDTVNETVVAVGEDTVRAGAAVDGNGIVGCGRIPSYMSGSTGAFVTNVFAQARRAGYRRVGGERRAASVFDIDFLTGVG